MSDPVLNFRFVRYITSVALVILLGSRCCGCTEVDDPGAITAVASGQALLAALAGSAEVIFIQLIYTNGKNCTLDVYANLTLCFDDGVGCSDLFDTASMQLDSGQYQLLYITSVATLPSGRPYTVLIYLNGTRIANDGTQLSVLPAPTDGSNCNASGPGLTESWDGVAAWFLVSSYDTYGNVVPYPLPYGDTPHVTILPCLDYECRAVDSTRPVPSETVYVADGVYNVSYTGPAAGEYNASVIVSGDAIAGSPFNIISYPNTATAQAAVSKTPWLVALVVTVAAVVAFFAILLKMMHSTHHSAAERYPPLSPGSRQRQQQQSASGRYGTLPAGHASAVYDAADDDDNGDDERDAMLAPGGDRRHSGFGDSDDDGRDDDDGRRDVAPGSGRSINGDSRDYYYPAAPAGRSAAAAAAAGRTAAPAAAAAQSPTRQHPAAQTTLAIVPSASGTTVPAASAGSSVPSVPMLPTDSYFDYAAGMFHCVREILPDHPGLAHVVPHRYQIANSYLKGRSHDEPPQVFLGPASHVVRICLVRWVRSLEYCTKRDPEFLQGLRRTEGNDADQELPAVKLEEQQQPGDSGKGGGKGGGKPKRKRPSRAAVPPPDPPAVSGIHDFEPQLRALLDADTFVQPKDGLVMLQYRIAAGETMFHRWHPNPRASKCISKSVFYEHAISIEYVRNGELKRALSPGFFIFSHSSFRPAADSAPKKSRKLLPSSNPSPLPPAKKAAVAGPRQRPATAPAASAAAVPPHVIAPVLPRPLSQEAPVPMVVDQQIVALQQQMQAMQQELWRLQQQRAANMHTTHRQHPALPAQRTTALPPHQQQQPTQSAAAAVLSSDWTPDSSGVSTPESMPNLTSPDISSSCSTGAAEPPLTPPRDWYGGGGGGLHAWPLPFDVEAAGLESLVAGVPASPIAGSVQQQRRVVPPPPMVSTHVRAGDDMPAWGGFDTRNLSTAPSSAALNPFDDDPLLVDQVWPTAVGSGSGSLLSALPLWQSGGSGSGSGSLLLQAGSGSGSLLHQLGSGSGSMLPTWSGSAGSLLPFSDALVDGAAESIDTAHFGLDDDSLFYSKSHREVSVLASDF